jgi:putative endonuclease
MEKLFAVYIMTNQWNNVFYIGITSNLPKRVWEHKNKVVEGFSKKYNLNKLVYYEVFSHPYEAINREKKMKSLKRTRKIQLITAFNPEWEDLYERL